MRLTHGTNTQKSTLIGEQEKEETQWVRQAGDDEAECGQTPDVVKDEEVCTTVAKR